MRYDPDSPQFYYREKPRKLKGKEREAEILRIIAEMKVDYDKLNKIWGICQYEDQGK